MAGPCEHLRDLTAVDFPAPVSADGCEDCLVEGTHWVALRACRTCGHVACCDSSPRRHAKQHFHETGHPVMRSIMPGDTWSWCYVHEAYGDLTPVTNG
jgi:monovalent cation/hydrogen antiporter